MGTHLLFDFANLFSIKYIAAVLIAAATFSLLMQAVGSNTSISAWRTASDTITLSVMLFALIFIMFVIYRIFHGVNFYFVSLACSAWAVFTLVALVISLHDVLVGESDFHILQVLLSIAAALVVGSVFSVFVMVAQTLIAHFH